MAAHEYYNVSQVINQSDANNATKSDTDGGTDGFMSKPAVKITQVVLKGMIQLNN